MWRETSGLLLIGFWLGFGQTVAAARSRISGDFNSIGAALRMYETMAGEYPSEEQGLRALVERPAGFPSGVRWESITGALPVDPWQNEYQYVLGPSAEYDFGLYSFGPDGLSESAGNDQDDIASWRDRETERRQRSQWWVIAGIAGSAGLVLLGSWLRRIRARRL